MDFSEVFQTSIKFLCYSNDPWRIGAQSFVNHTSPTGLPKISIRFSQNQNHYENLNLLHCFDSFSAENRFTCDCRLAWVYDLSNRTRNEDLRESLSKIECTLGKKTYYSNDPRQTQSVDSTLLEPTFDDDGDYIEDAAENESTVEEKPEVVNLFKLGKEQLPCPEELIGPTDGPNPRESKGLLDLPWGHSGVSAIRPSSSSTIFSAVARIFVSSVGLVMISSIRL